MNRLALSIILISVFTTGILAAEAQYMGKFPPTDAFRYFIVDGNNIEADTARGYVNFISGTNATLTVGANNTITFSSSGGGGSADCSSNVACDDEESTFTEVQEFIGWGSGMPISGQTDIHLGTQQTDGGGIRIGNTTITHRATSTPLGPLNIGGSTIVDNQGDPKGNSVYIFSGVGNTIAFAIPKVEPGLATINTRSMIVAGPSANNDNIFQNTTWGFNNLDMDVTTTGADLGVQDDIQVLGDIYLGGNMYGGNFTEGATINTTTCSAGDFVSAVNNSTGIVTCTTPNKSKFQVGTLGTTAITHPMNNEFLPITDSINSGGTELARDIAMAFDGEITVFYLRSAGITTTADVTFTLRVNGISSAHSLTFTPTTDNNTQKGLTGFSLPFNAGDRVSILITTSSASGDFNFRGVTLGGTWD